MTEGAIAAITPAVVASLLIGCAVVVGASGRVRSQTSDAVAVLVAATAFVFIVRAHLQAVADAVIERPAWFGLTALVAGLATGGSASRALRVGRVDQVLVSASLTALAAAAALPDVEVLVGLSALMLPWGAVAFRPRPEGSTPETLAPWLRRMAAAGVGALVALALLDGARGRPGAILIAPVIVAPIVVAAPAACRSSVAVVALRAVIGFSVGVAVARHAGLGDGTARPVVGAAVGTVVFLVVAWLVRRPTPRPIGVERKPGKGM